MPGQEGQLVELGAALVHIGVLGTRASHVICAGSQVLRDLLCIQKRRSSGLYRKPRRKKTQDLPLKKDFPGFFRVSLKLRLVPTAGFELAT